MNQQQKEQIAAFRSNGESCAKIAAHLGLSVNTVKSFCRRNIGVNTKSETKNTAEAAAEIASCPQCGSKITQIGGRKPKRFCSDKCRVLWWNSHSENVRRKALYSFTCAACGQEFTAYGNANRRYCSHSCYCKDRFGRSPADSGNADGGRKAVAV